MSPSDLLGDIDAKGLCIVNDLRAAGINANTMLMDFPTYEAYEKYGAWTDERGRPVPCSPRRNLPALTPDERLLYLHLTDPAWDRIRRVEQERIPLNVAAEYLASRMEILRQNLETSQRRR